MAFASCIREALKDIKWFPKSTNSFMEYGTGPIKIIKIMHDDDVRLDASSSSSHTSPSMPDAYMQAQGVVLSEAAQDNLSTNNNKLIAETMQKLLRLKRAFLPNLSMLHKKANIDMGTNFQDLVNKVAES